MRTSIKKMVCSPPKGEDDWSMNIPESLNPLNEPFMVQAVFRC